MTESTADNASSSSPTSSPIASPTSSIAIDKPVPKPQSLKRLTLLLVLSIVLAVAALAGSAYLWWQAELQQQRAQKSQTDVAAMLQRLNAEANNNRELQRQLDQQAAHFQQQQQQVKQQLDSLQQKIDSQKKRLLAMATTDRADWLLAEAEYLIRLANQRLLMGKELKGAQQLLQAADTIAKELDDSALYPLREALAGDVASLRAAAKFDLEGVYLQLSALSQQAQRLQLIALPELQSSEIAEAVGETWQQRLQSGLRAAGEKLSTYVQIKRRDEIYQPLLAPDQEAALRQNIQLMFEQAQMAALAGKQRLYDDSLAKAKHWLNTYYNLDQEATAAMSSNIDHLAEQKIEVVLPDISGSLRALKAYLDTMHDVVPEATTRARNENTAESEQAQ